MLHGANYKFSVLFTTHVISRMGMREPQISIGLHSEEKIFFFLNFQLKYINFLVINLDSYISQHIISWRFTLPILNIISNVHHAQKWSSKWERPILNIICNAPHAQKSLSKWERRRVRESASNLSRQHLWRGGVKSIIQKFPTVLLLEKYVIFLIINSN